jgi:predicted transcriptional regulator
MIYKANFMADDIYETVSWDAIPDAELNDCLDAHLHVRNGILVGQPITKTFPSQVSYTDLKTGKDVTKDVTMTYEHYYIFYPSLGEVLVFEIEEIPLSGFYTVYTRRASDEECIDSFTSSSPLYNFYRGHNELREMVNK